MQNLYFLIWMLFFPLIESIATYIDYLAKGKKVEKVENEAEIAITMIVIYFTVGYMLYNN